MPVNKQLLQDLLELQEETPEAAAEAATLSDGAVVGSAVVDLIAENVAEDGSGNEQIVQKIAAFVGNLAKGVATSTAS